MRQALFVLAFVCGLAPGAALAAGGEGGLINLDKSLFIQAANFLLLLFLLTRLLYRPLIGKMEERAEAIKRSLQEAEAARAEAARQRAEHAAQIQAAHAEAQAIRAQALKEAQDEQQKLVAQARAEAARLVETARAELDQDVRRARQQLRQEVADLAIGAAERLIRRSLREEDHRRIVQEALAGMERGGS
jgi:F-type H+-transporting ATPase subunit b